MSRHSLWRFMEWGRPGRAVPQAIVNKVGNSVQAIQYAPCEFIIDLQDLEASLRCPPEPGFHGTKRVVPE